MLEGSNTAVKKFVKNLIVLGLNSPECLTLMPFKWLDLLKRSKSLQNVLQNLLGLPDQSQYNDFILLLYNIYVDFISSLTALFELWYSSSDLTEEEFKKVDSKIIYWLPNINAEKLEPTCFEKYLSDYWKEDLQKKLLTEHVHDFFSKHKKKNCCDNFDKEKNIFRIFTFSQSAAFYLMQILYNENMVVADRNSPETDKLQTITELSLKEICVLRPEIEGCEKHKECVVIVKHDESCLEPYVCNADPPCIITCENSKSQNKEKKGGKFWKSITVQVFRTNKKQRDVCTLAESSDRCIETYMNVRGKSDFDFNVTMLKYFTSQYLNDWQGLDFNRRKNECLDRLRRKLRDKHITNSEPYDKEALKDPVCRMKLLEDAETKLMGMEMRYCYSSDDCAKCSDGDCFKRDYINTVCINSSEVFGRVVCLAKTSITFSKCSVQGCDSPVKQVCDPDCPRSTMTEMANCATQCLVQRLISGCAEESMSKPSKSAGKIDTCCQTVICNKVAKEDKAVKEEQKKAKTSKTKDEVEKAKNDSIPTNESKPKKDQSTSTSGSERKKDNAASALERNKDKAVSTIEQKENHMVGSGDGHKVIKEVNAVEENKDNEITGGFEQNNDNKTAGVVQQNKDTVSDIEQKKVDIKVTDEIKMKNGNEIEGKKYKEDKTNETEMEKHMNSNVVAEVDEILKVIGIGLPAMAESQQEVDNDGKLEYKESHNANQSTPNEDKAVEDLLSLLCMKKASPAIEISSKISSDSEKVIETKKVKLRICAYCRKKEAVRKTFKRCSKCKEENFPEQRYYCSRECLREDWTESHEEEHLKNKKSS